MLDGIIEMFSPRKDRDRAVAALRALTDHELADLGILRDQVEAYIGGASRAAATRSG
jgi:hypothetical protein